MKKFNWSKLLFVFTLIAVLALAACSGDERSSGSGSGDSEGSSGETITLRAATGLSAQHAWWAASMEPWMEKVEELTDGKVQFETFVGGELVNVPDEADAVLNGTIDVGLLLPIYEPDQYPMAEVTMLPLSHSDTYIASNAWRKLIESEIELADGKTYYDFQFDQFKVFPVSATQEYSISTTGKEFNSVDDIVGTSLRTPSRIHEIYAEKTGINSITIAAVEMYDAMSRGAFDGSFYSIADWSGYGFQDLFKYTLIGINFGHFNALIGMKKETWESLPEDVQQAMEQAYEEIFIPGADEWVNRAEVTIEENEAEGGKFVDFATLDQSVQDHFNKGIEETWIEYAELLEKDGLPGYELIKLWRDIIIEEGGDVPVGIKNIE